MKSWMVGLAALLASSGAAATVVDQPQVPVRTAQVGENIDWSFEKAPRGSSHRVGQVTLTFRNDPDPEMADLPRPALQVSMPGYQPVVLHGEPTGASFEHRATVGRWSADGTPFVYFQSFSGGAHCCNRIQVVVPENGKLEIYDLGSWDGGYSDNVPTDVDGDGAVDFVMVDNSFLYTFASYADSFAPPQVLNFINGKVEDVSARPGFRRLFEAAARDARPICTGNESFRNGACASYVAASARLGRFDEAWAEMLRHHESGPDWPHPSSCRIDPGEQACPEDQVVNHSDYPSALRAFLVQQRYIAR
jgi:hypothetical protein